jgi:hypothetical protein
VSEDADVAAARTAIEQLTGSPPLRMELIVRYGGRLVCIVTLPDRRLVFKAGPEDSVSLEAWASETLRPLGVGTRPWWQWTSPGVASRSPTC